VVLPQPPSSRVLETTYLGSVLKRSAKSPVRDGQASAKARVGVASEQVGVACEQLVVLELVALLAAVELK
jgi:hypothetical protein